MRLDKLQQGIALMNAFSGVLRTAAVTLGPHIRRMQGEHVDPSDFQGASLGFGSARLVCAQCNGDDVTVEAVAKWDAQGQQWACEAVFEHHAHCEECGPTSLRRAAMQSRRS